MQLAFR